MKQVIISGEAVGSGSDKYRYVRGLSDEAKQALLDNSALVICERPFEDRYGPWYVVYRHISGWDHKLPTPNEKKLINEYTRQVA